MSNLLKADGTPFEGQDLGWIRAPQEVDKVIATLPYKSMSGITPASDEQTEVLAYEIYRKIVGRDEYPGPQLIGDCVGHGYKRMTDYLAVIQMHMQLKTTFGDTMQYGDPEVEQLKSQLLEEFQETSCEAIYALSRVEVGTMDGSYSDGSVGAWAAKAIQDYGTISWKALQAAGLSGTYDHNRAKQWGAKGLPNELESVARQHLVKVVTPVRNFKEAAALCQNGYTIAICSDRGFTTQRDNQGFCQPSGTWNHCMMLSSSRWDRPGLLCHQNWGRNNPSGPKYKDQPDNTFWVDAKVVDYILAQNDSFTGSGLMGYPVQNLLTWKH